MFHKAKIQIRPFDEEVIKFVYTHLKKEGIKITEEKKLKEGLDVHTHNATFAVTLSRKFKQRFNGETKITRSLIGENKNKGKRIYRLTVLLRRLPEEEPL
jgi:NMD protein affecting ribosome stability and mRNA decay